MCNTVRINMSKHHDVLQISSFLSALKCLVQNSSIRINIKVWQKLPFIPFFRCINMKQLTIISIVNAMTMKTSYSTSISLDSETHQKLVIIDINLIKNSPLISLKVCFCRPWRIELRYSDRHKNRLTNANRFFLSDTKFYQFNRKNSQKSSFDLPSVFSETTLPYVTITIWGICHFQ